MRYLGVNLMCLFSSTSCILTLPLSAFMCCIHILTKFPVLDFNIIKELRWEGCSGGQPVQPPSQSKFNCIKLLREWSLEDFHAWRSHSLGPSFSIWPGCHGDFFPQLSRISHVKNSLSLCIGTFSSLPAPGNPDPYPSFSCPQHSPASLGDVFYLLWDQNFPGWLTCVSQRPFPDTFCHLNFISSNPTDSSLSIVRTWMQQEVGGGFLLGGFCFLGFLGFFFCYFFFRKPPNLLFCCIFKSPGNAHLTAQGSRCWRSQILQKVGHKCGRKWGEVRV